jgi:hypothetical protein
MTDGDRHALMGLWPDANGDVYLASSAAGKVLKITASGQVSVFCASPIAYAPTGVTGTATEVVVLEYAAGDRARVRRFRKDGSEKR